MVDVDKFGKELYIIGILESEYRFDEKIQECYSLRCVPQILGPILDTINNSEDVLIREANSADDNPIIDPDIKKVYHGGNFHGDYISLEMDKLKIVQILDQVHLPISFPITSNLEFQLYMLAKCLL